MNFLALCQRLAFEAGVEGESQPTSVVSQTGELGRVVRWVNSAWLDIQQMHNWSWMWEHPTLVLTTAASSIAGTVGADRYDRESAYFDDGSPAKRLLTYQPWQEFRESWRVLAQNDGVTVWSVRPDFTLVFNAAASANKNIDLERWMVPTELAADADTPGMPSDLHEVIVWRALVKYANFDEARVQRDTAIDEYKSKMGALMRRCLPVMSLGGPLGED